MTAFSFFFSSRRRHTRSYGDWSSDVCSSDLEALVTSGAVGDYQKYVCRMVRYYHGHDLPGNVWAIPDLITTTKLKKFAYQEEYRFAYTKTDAFKFENVEVKLVDRKARPAPKPEEHAHETLHLGD